MQTGRLLFIDTEWANPDRSICQIGVIFRDASRKQEESRSIVIDPKDDFDPDYTAVHGIDAATVEGCPDFKEVWKVISPYLEDSIVIGHNVRETDLMPLNREASRYGLVFPVVKYIDTEDLARCIIGRTKVRNYSRSSVCRFLDIVAEKLHNAIRDAEGCMSLFDQLCAQQENFDPSDYVRTYVPNTDGGIVRPGVDVNRRIGTLYGIVKGICIDGFVTESEVKYLSKWSEQNEDIRAIGELTPLMEAMDRAIGRETVSPDELMGINASLNTYIQEQRMGRETSAVQELHGIVLGVQCDQKITIDEMDGLKQWMYDNGDLAGSQPYDEIFDILKEVAESCSINKAERARILAAIEDVFNPLRKIERQMIDLSGRTFCLCGFFEHGSQEDVVRYLESNGGIVHESVKRNTDYVIIGEGKGRSGGSCPYESKLRRAEELGTTILKECQIFDD